jgi:hypothetical protein
MTGITNTKALFLSLAKLWLTFAEAKAKGNGTISFWGWLKLVWANKKTLTAGFRGVGELKAELFDLTGEEMDELRDETLRALRWQPTDAALCNFAIIFKAVRDNVETLLLLKNTVRPPRAEIVP